MANQSTPTKKSLLQKRFPTILGLIVLVVGLVAGTIFFSQGSGVFAPRATPETTPKNVKITNVTERNFTVSFLTEEPTEGYVSYGTNPDQLKQRAGDDRDQIRGTIEKYKLHHITVSGLDPQTTYYFLLGTGNGTTFDDTGSPFMIKSAKRGTTAPAAKTIYGSVTTASGGPASGTIVYVKLAGAGEMSSLVKDSGSWAVPLSNARKTDGSDYAEITDESALIIVAQGEALTENTELSTSVGEYEPGTAMALGQGKIAASTSSDDSTMSEDSIKNISPTPSIEVEVDEPELTSTSASELSPTPVNLQVELDEDASSSTTPAKKSTGPSGQLAGLLDPIEASSEAVIENSVVDLQETEPQVVTTSNPIIKGKAAPQARVVIKVHSDTQIEEELITDEFGNFALDIGGLSEKLEPGEHTVEFSYIDPDTGEEVIQTHSFTVAARSGSQLAQAYPSPTPAYFGTDYPYSGNATVSATPAAPKGVTESAIASASATPTPATRSSVPSTESGVPVSGAIGTTLALIFGGLFFIISGVWSFWIAVELNKEE